VESAFDLSVGPFLEWLEFLGSVRVERPTTRYCVFCEIIAGREPADVLYQNDEVIVFRNRLKWVPVMLLAVPKQHMTQKELWHNIGSVGKAAVEMGERHCPNGFRLLSNVGFDAMQSQEHAHIHVIGGTFLGEYA
jgi:histidine triad (HIT) family protein